MTSIRQILAISFFNLLSLPARKGAAITAAVGIAGVVGVLVGVLAISEGFKKAMTAAGSPDVAIVLRTGADMEMNSGISREGARVIADAPGIAREDGVPLASAELLVMVNLIKKSTGAEGNIPVRGVQPTAFDVRGNIQFIEGRKFARGKNEVIVGAGVARAFENLMVGDSFRTGRVTWRVAGIFTCDGGVAESEIWADAEVLAPAYDRSDGFQSVYVRLASPDALATLENAIGNDPKLSSRVIRQTDFYEEQSKVMTTFITTIGIFISSMMGLGALFGALNTMYSAVAGRTREISTLRALGFGRFPVVVSVVAESLALSLIGGALGAVAAYFLLDGYQTSTMNFQTFSQLSFAFSVTGRLLLAAVFFATFIGFLGGIFPAMRAARIPIAAGLRES